MARFLVIGAAALLMLGVTGCAPSDYRVEFTGPKHGYGYACAQLASSGSLWVEPGTPSAVWVSSVVWEGDGRDFTFSGVTRVQGSDGERKFEWTCQASVGADQRELSVVLDSFSEVE